MAQYTPIDALTKTLQMLKLMARENGANVTEISRETRIDRWTARDMIDRMEGFNPDGKGLYIEEYVDPADRRQTRYRVPKDNLWTLTLPGLNLNDEEALLLALMFDQGFNSPELKDSSVSLRKKLNMFRNYKEYEVLNVNQAKKIHTLETRKTIIGILNAIRDEKCVKFLYKPVRREPQEYEIMPLAVFRYDGGFYLAAQKLPAGEFRTFGLERVVSVPTVFDYSGVLPEKVDYSERFNDPFGPFNHGEEFEAVLKFDAFGGFYNAEKKWPDSVTIQTLEDESVIMHAKTRSKSGIIRFILAFGTEVEVLEPQWLRDEIKESLKKSTEIYEN